MSAAVRLGPAARAGSGAFALSAYRPGAIRFGGICASFGRPSRHAPISSTGAGRLLGELRR